MKIRSVGEPIVTNDLKGVGPFILAGIEVQQLIHGKSSGSAGGRWLVTVYMKKS